MHSTNENVEIYITTLGLLVNLIMAVGKGLAGYLFHSQALLADGCHSLTDLVADLITLATVSLPLPSTSMAHSSSSWFSRRKIKSFGALAVSILLLVGGVAMGLTSLGAISILSLETRSPQVHEDKDVPGLSAAWVAAASVVVKEWLYQSTKKVAIKRKSAVLASNAMHHRIDSLSSVVVLLTVGYAHMFEAGARWCDPVGGLVIARLVIKAGWQNARQEFVKFLGTSEQEILEKLE